MSLKTQQTEGNEPIVWKIDLMIFTIFLLVPNQLFEKKNVSVNQSYTDKKPPLCQGPKGVDKKLQWHLFSEKIYSVQLAFQL